MELVKELEEFVLKHYFDRETNSWRFMAEPPEPPVQELPEHDFDIGGEG